ncbi:dihydrolipoamide acetyltransferase family protein [Sinomonas soli]
MPEVLAGAAEAVVAAWAIAEGSPFTAGDTLAEIETEKALVDLPAEQDGILGRILAQPGATTSVGSPIAVVIGAGETQADIEAALGEAIAEAGAAGEAPADAEAAAAGEASPQTTTHAAVPVTTSGNGGSLPSDGARPVGRIFASPVSRRRAKDAGIALDSIQGTGPGGRIVRADVEAAIVALETARTPTAPSTAAPAAPTRPGPIQVPAEPVQKTAAVAGSYTEIPHTGMRRAIARRLTESKSTVPHFYLTAECRVDALLALRKQLNDFSPVKISVNDLVVKAVAAAYVEVPEANVTWTDTHLRHWDNVDISVAVATETGLLTPVVREADRLSLSGVSTRISELAGRAREGRIRQDELEGGTVSVTNLGMFGTLEFAAILNPPQSAILAVGAAKPAPVVIDGALQVATTMRCTLSVDHRAVDGALAARWLAAFTSRIENPLSILA